MAYNIEECNGCGLGISSLYEYCPYCATPLPRLHVWRCKVDFSWYDLPHQFSRRKVIKQTVIIEDICMSDRTWNPRTSSKYHEYQLKPDLVDYSEPYDIEDLGPYSNSTECRAGGPLTSWLGTDSKTK